MEILKYESFLETMQFAALTNAQKLAKQEEERRRKAKQEADNKDTTPVKQTPIQNDDTEEEVQMETGSEEAQMETEEREEEPEGE